MRAGKFIPAGGAGVLVLTLLSMMALSLSLWLLFPRMSASERLARGFSGPVEMPWVFREVSSGNHLSVSVPVNWLTPRWWNITPDDHLAEMRINGQVVPLDGVRPGGLNDWQRGFGMDLSPWLHSGDNSFEFTVDNYGWDGGIALRPVLGWRLLLLAASLLPWLLALARVFRLPRSQTVVLGIALIVLCCYWAATPWTLRNYDVKHLGETGHLDYVNYVASQWALPRPDRGWEYFQPPLYYIGGALVWRWAQWLNLAGPEALQAFALALWLVFLAASAATLQLALGRRRPQVLVATAALALWPSGIIHGLRIGNDPALYAAAAVATWFMFRWWRGGRRRHLLGMALSIAAALLCKGSALPLLAAAAALIALRTLRAGRWRKHMGWTEAGLAGAVMAAGAALALGRNFYYWWRGETASWLIGSVGTLDANLRVPKQFRDFLPLDIPVFLTSPWMDSRDNATGRANFWNYLLRSSLSGEVHFDGALQRGIAFIWGVLLLWLIGLLVLRAAAARWSVAAAWRNAPWTALTLLWLGSLLCLRISQPFSCHSDFRLILPVLVPLLIACTRAGAVARLVLAAMALGSAVFFVTL